MEVALSVLVGALFACGFYLLMQRNLLRMIFGLAILNNAANLLVMTVGRITRGQPALIDEGATVPASSGNPLPQALTLTAVVIGFGLLAFTLVLVYRSYPALGTLDTDTDPHTRED
jgi:multicomponent Na+:H+ antiporter subunit C